MKCKPNTAFARFECVNPETSHRKFYELSVEMLLDSAMLTNHR